MQPGEFTIEMPAVLRPPIATPQHWGAGIVPLPGRFVGVFDPPREESAGGILLPSNGLGYSSEGAAAEATRPDCVTIMYVGAPKDLGNGKEIRVPLEPGDRVLIRPYYGMRHELFEHGGIQVRDLGFFGVEDSWDECAIAVFRHGEWWPLSDWMLLEMQPESRDVLLLETTALRTAVFGRVEKCGPDTSVEYDQEVLLSPDAERFDTRFGPWGHEMVFVKESRIDFIENTESLERVRQALAVKVA